MTPSMPARLAIAAVIVVALASSPFWLAHTPIPDLFHGGEALRARIEALGFWGPLGVVALMIVAILISPLPSAPIALAAGAVYGHFWGTLYVLVGSEIGAIAAFSLARFLGHDAIHRRFGDRLSVGLAGSQAVLMATVFATRLMPFLSFDMVSYAAGLTVLSLWRFVLATLAGILPASFVLAHLGSEMMSEESSRILLSVLLLGLLTGLPVIVGLVARWRHGRGKAAP